MNTTDGLPIILLVFSNETKKNLDGSDNKRYLEKVDQEKKLIIKAIETANEKLEEPICEYKVLEGSKANVNEIFEEFIKDKGRVVALHFAGHADGYQLLLQSAEENTSVAAYAGGLNAFLRQQPYLKFVFLNGCETHEQAKELYDMGIPAVIGTNSPIGDEVAKDFAQRFYQSLAQGVSLEHAWDHAISLLMTKTSEPLGIQVDRSASFAKLRHGKKRIFWELFTETLDWDLGSEAKNPLFGLPVPLERELPPAPFRYLERYQEEHAELFFGRGREIRRLFSLLISQQESPLILFHGQSGVGKSSVLEAGLFPRLKARSADLGNRIAFPS